MIQWRQWRTSETACVVERSPESSTKQWINSCTYRHTCEI